LLESAGLEVSGIALHAPEKFGVKELRGHGAAAEAHKRLARSGRGLVHRLGQKILARAGFTGDQHRGIVLGDDRHEAKEFFHGRTAANDLTLSRGLGQTGFNFPQGGQVFDHIKNADGTIVAVRYAHRSDAHGDLAAVTVDAIGLDAGSRTILAPVRATLDAGSAAQDMPAGQSAHFLPAVAGQGFKGLVEHEDSARVVQKDDAHGQSVEEARKIRTLASDKFFNPFEHLILP